jgi:hypothetical protein
MRTTARMWGRSSSPLHSSAARSAQHTPPSILRAHAWPFRQYAAHHRARRQTLLHSLPIAGVVLVTFSPSHQPHPSLDDRLSSAGCVSPTSPPCATLPRRVRITTCSMRGLSAPESKRLQPFVTEAHPPPACVHAKPGGILQKC